MSWLQKSTLLPICLLGVLLGSPPASPLQTPCELVKTTGERGSFQLNVNPLYYLPGAIYTVSVGAENGTSVILQILPAGDSTEGLWEDEDRLIRCSNNENVVQKNFSSSTDTWARWISPITLNVGSAQIRAFVTFANGTTLLKTTDLEKQLASSGAPSSSPKPTRNAVKPTLLSNSTDSHLHLNSTPLHQPLASSHQWTKGPPSSVSMAQANSFLFVAMQVLSITLGYKLLG